MKIQLAKEFRREPTPAESILWQALRRNQLDGLHFRRQHVVGGFVVDFFCNSAALAVEVDGSIHVDQAQSDAERDAALTLLGLNILRVPNDDVLHHLPIVLSAIRAAAASRAPSTDPPATQSDL